MDKVKLLDAVKRMGDLYSEYEDNEYSRNIVRNQIPEDEYDSTEELEELQRQDELFEKKFKESSVIKEPVDRIKRIIEDDSFEVGELELNSERLYRILELLPENRRAYNLYDSILSKYMGVESIDAVGEVFKECGETLEDFPVDYLAESHFLYSYITHRDRNDPELKKVGFLDIKENREDIINLVKEGFSKGHTLSEIRDAARDEKPLE